MKRVLLMAMVAGALFACNKQEPTDTDGGKNERTVTLSIQQDALSAKGIGDQKGTNEFAVIGSGKLYFINGSGVSIYQRELTATEIADLANTSSTAGGKTVTITGVPNTATTLYFMANIKTSAGTTFPKVDGMTSADARLRIDKLQADVTHAPMSGISTPFSPVAGSTNVFTTSVTLTPIVARLEVGQVTCQNQNGAAAPAVSADITGYKLAGVFINNVRQSVLLNGTPYLVGSPIDIKSQSGWALGWPNYFTSANSVFPYYVGGTPAAPADWVPNAMVDFCTPPTSAMTFYPDATLNGTGATTTPPTAATKPAWAYQICPSTTVGAGVDADVPHIILKLTDVTYSDNELGLTTQYVTVTKYKKADATNTPVVKFERGNVYRITNLTFSHNEATNQPYEKNITVTATVSVAPWVINNIDPDWN